MSGVVSSRTGWIRLSIAGLAAGLCLAGLAAVPSFAPAATITESSCFLGGSCTETYAGAAGETNTLTVTFSSGTDLYTFTDTTATSLTESGTHCTVTDATPPTVVATCADGGLNTNIDDITLNLGDMDDFATAAAVAASAGDPFTVNGGTGNDTISGSQSDSEAINGDAGNDTFENPVADTSGDTLNGGADTDTASYATRSTVITADLDGFSGDDGESGEGDSISALVENLIGGSNNDTLTGNSGADNVITGNAGSDTMRGEANTITNDADADTFRGGSETDTVTYSSRVLAINVTLDDVANDGEPTETDNVGPGGDVENVIGGSFNDTLTGNALVNALDGQGGNDTLDGGALGDTLTGGAGTADLVTYATRTNAIIADIDGTADDGESGENDNVTTTVENLTGGSGNDQLTGSASANSLNGGPSTGYDRLTGLGGADVIDGAAGIDRAIYDASTSATTITIDNTANDTDGTGATTENVMDTVESITGSLTAADTLTGSCFNNVLAGQGGNDTLNGDPTLCTGGFGGDFMGGGTGNDTMLGSVTPTPVDGVDRVTYTANTAAEPTSITLDGMANDTDGTGGTDNVGQDIEYLYGGPEVDNFSACGQLATPPSPAPAPCLPVGPQAMQGVSFWGGLGNDVFYGSDMNDYMDGQGGADAINCEGGTGDMNKTDGADPAPISCETPVP